MPSHPDRVRRNYKDEDEPPFTEEQIKWIISFVARECSKGFYEHLKAFHGYGVK